MSILFEDVHLGLGKDQTVFYNNGSLYNTNGSAYSGEVKGFLANVIGALNTIGGSSEGTMLIGDLAKSANTFTIQQGASEFYRSSNIGAHWNVAYSASDQASLIAHGRDGSGGSGGVIQWDPSGSLLPLVGGSGTNAAMDLAHEMSHAADANMGLMDNRIHGAGLGSSRNEWQAVYRENIIRGQLNLPLRVSHRSSYNPNTGAVGPLQPYMLSNGTNGTAITPTWNNWRLR